MEAFGYDAMLKQQSILPMGLPTALGPILEITNHTSLNEEKVTRFGQTYNVHVVVKNSPFVVTVAMRGNSRGHSFNHLGSFNFPPLNSLTPQVSFQILSSFSQRFSKVPFESFMPKMRIYPSCSFSTFLLEFLKLVLMVFFFLAFDISLIYDMPGLDKPVTYVSTKPVDYKPLISDSGDEIRHALPSVHELICELHCEFSRSFFRNKYSSS